MKRKTTSKTRTRTSTTKTKTSKTTTNKRLHSGPQDADEAHAHAIALGARCHECPLYGCRSGPVMGEAGGLSLMAIGKGPGVTEVERGRPHIGTESVAIRRILGKAHLTNAWLCRAPPPSGDDMDLFVRRLRLKDKTRQSAENRCAKRERRKPKKLALTPTPAQCCAPRLAREIRESGAAVVTTLGVDALKAVAAIYGIPVGKAKIEHPDNLHLATIKSQMGHPFRIEAKDKFERQPVAFTLYGTMHPAAAGEGRSTPHLRGPIHDHMRDAVKLAKAGGRWREPKADELILPPDRWNRDFYHQIVDWARRYRAAGSPTITVDVETEGVDWYTKVRCVGMGADIRGPGGKIIESIIVVPVRYRDGRDYWPLKANRKVRAILHDLLNG